MQTEQGYERELAEANEGEAVSPKPAPRRDRQWWETHYEAWQNSGQTKAVFCQHQGLNVHSFGNWCGKIGRARRAALSTPGAGEPSTFVAATVTTSPSPSTAAAVEAAVSVSVGEVTVRFEAAMSAKAVAHWAQTLRNVLC